MTDQEKTELLETKLISERREWNGNVSDLVGMSKRVDKLSESQVLMLSYRQILVDKLTDMKNTISRKISSNYSYIAERTRYYKTQHNVKLMDKDIKEFINADMSDNLAQLEMLKNQIDYYRSTIDTLDKLGFAIKNRILIEQHNL